MHDERDQAEIHLDLWPTPLLQISLARLGGGGGGAVGGGRGRGSLGLYYSRGGQPSWYLSRCGSEKNEESNGERTINVFLTSLLGVDVEIQICILSMCLLFCCCWLVGVFLFCFFVLFCFSFSFFCEVCGG